MTIIHQIADAVSTADAVPPSSLDWTDGLTITEAARVLGTSRDAIRQRIRRGSIDACKHEGVWLVRVNSFESAVEQQDLADGPSVRPRSPSPDAEGAVRKSKKAEESSAAPSPHTQDLITQLRSEIAFLHEDAERRAEELRRKDTIIMTLAQQIALLPKPRTEAASTNGAGQEGRTDGPVTATGIHVRSQPWWRRVLAALVNAPPRA